MQRIIVLQYNPDTLSRTLQPQTVKEAGDRSEATRLTGLPVETIELDAEIDATNCWQDLFWNIFQGDNA